MWSRDPDPSDDTCVVDFAFLLRDGKTMRAVHDPHTEGHASDLFLCRRAKQDVEARTA